MRFPVLASLALAVALPLAAQQPAASSPAGSLPVMPGSRVRLSASTMVSPLVANFLEMRGDTAVFIEAIAGRGIWTFTLDQIQQLERSDGDKRFNRGPMVQYGAIGAGAGLLAIWGITGILSPSDSTRKYDRTASAAVGLALGGAIGTFLGSRVTRERWMHVPLPRRVSVAPWRRDGVRVGLDFGF